ncbi:RDD family protein [Schnuerera sp. xch1]|uniref:RDD family protein n=1 Tax=Schnuerera sp. xch1 TaxID=2874283 RepID=UPI001CBA6FC3|nr:RDD family protein [Schnuerera sp. xch1]MBZ2175376.1 RDD family protein [Schnuerera sp. xch1]
MSTKTSSITLQSQRVGIFKRGIAAMIDIYISSVLANIPILFIYSIETGETEMSRELSALSSTSGILACILGILLILLYYVVIPVYKFQGQTLMKKLLGFKVMKTDSSNVDLKTMLKREAIGSMIVEGGLISSGNYLRQLILIITRANILHTGLLYISFGTTILSIIYMVFSKEHRTLHDYIAGTRVLDLKS